MKQTYSFLILILGVMAFWSCSKTDMNTQGPIEKDGTKPGAVSNVKVQNTPGGAVITYSLPADEDLQYVLAEYAINSTTTRQAKTSRFNDTIRVDGFVKAGEYDVRLYAVDRSENRSDELIVKVKPSTPPYRQIASSLTLNNDFGGVNVTFENPNEDKIALVILSKNTNGELEPIETFYTQTKQGSFSARGYDPQKRLFGVYIKDRFNNTSDTLLKEMSPFLEKKLDKSKFRQYILPNDQPSAYDWEMRYMWDDKTGEPGFHTLQGAAPSPHRFTFDLGAVAKLSRFKILQRIDGGWQYQHGNPQIFNLYGSAVIPNSSGSWDGWIKLGSFLSKKPSGLPLGQTTNEDIVYAKGSDGLGEEFLIPIAAPAIRYIRFEQIKNWGNTDFFHALEITFWGNTQ